MLYLSSGKAIQKINSDGRYPIYGSNGVIGFTEKYNKTNSLLIGRVGAAGSVRLLNEKAWVTDNVLISSLGSKMDKKFAYYALINLELSRFATKSAQPLLTQSILRMIKVAVPPLLEQQKIASILSGVDALVEGTRQAADRAEKLKRGLMQTLLTRGIGHTRFRKVPWLFGREIEIPEEWRIIQFHQVFDYLKTGTNSRGDLNENGDIMYVHYGDIHSKWHLVLDCSLSDIPLIDKDKVGNLSLLKNGDLVIADASEDHEGSGASILVKNVNKKIVSGLHTIALRDTSQSTQLDFRAYITSIRLVKIQIIAYVTGISVYGLSKKNLGQIKIPLPSLTEQKPDCINPVRS